jgi:hypothetical protein
MDAVAAFHPFNKRRLAAVRGIVDRIHAGLVQSHRVQGGENADVRHLRVVGMGVAVAVHGQVVGHVDVGDILPPHKVHHRLVRVRHGLQEGIVVRGEYVVEGQAGGGIVNPDLAAGGSHADGHIFESAAETAHGVPFEMAEHQHGAVLLQMGSHVVLPQMLTALHRKRHVPLLVQKIAGRDGRETVLLHGMPVGH